MKKTKENNYFSEDFQESVRTMTPATMNALLLELGDTKYWIAVVKYLQNRKDFGSDALRTMDPVKDLVNLCRTQGILSGLSDLENAILTLKQSTGGKEKDSDEE